MDKKKIVVAITGASGSIYAKLLLGKLMLLSDQIEKADVVLSSNAIDVWKHELGNDFSYGDDFRVFKNDDFFAPFASGSAGYDCMIVCPCSMGVVGRVANGISNDLISRAGDVMLKERKKLILAVRETPYSQIHLKNMLALTEAGAIICPATPSFYSMPENIEQLANTVVDRILNLAGFSFDSYRWGG